MFLREVVALFVSKEDITNRTKLATVRIAGILALAILVIAIRASSQSLPSGFSDQEISVFNFLPTAIAIAPDDRIFITDKAGELRIIQDGQLLPTPSLSISVTTDAEAGLLGLALDPNFSQNGFLYLFYSTATGSLNFSGTPTNRVSRFAMDPQNPNLILPGSEVILLDQIPLQPNNPFHNAGCLRIGLDDALYISVGDTTQASFPQDLASLGGKILHINLDGTVPADNPFVGTPNARPEVWAYGLRNPWRFSFDPGFPI